MKKLLRILLTAVLATAMCAFVLVGCGGKGEGAALSGSVTIVMDNKSDPAKEVVASLEGFTDKNSPMDVIEKLTADGKLCYAGTNGVYGKFLTGIGVVEGEGENKKDVYIVNQNAAAGVYLYLYTSVESDQAEYDGVTSVTYKEQTLVESMVSISRMKLEDGAVYYVTTITWG